jgi:hypothetical protein
MGHEPVKDEADLRHRGQRQRERDVLVHAGLYTGTVLMRPSEKGRRACPRSSFPETTPRSRYPRALGTLIPFALAHSATETPGSLGTGPREARIASIISFCVGAFTGASVPGVRVGTSGR